MIRNVSTKLVGLCLAGTVATASEAAGDLQWMHDSGEWGAWGAYAVPDSDFILFSYGCTDMTGRLSLHVELPIRDASEGERSWLELRRESAELRFEGEVLFSEWHSEHQVIAHVPSTADTFDALKPYFDEPGLTTVAIPGASESFPIDAAAAEALATVREVCTSR